MSWSRVLPQIFLPVVSALSLFHWVHPPLLASLPATCWPPCVSSRELGQASAGRIPVVLCWGMIAVGAK